MAGAPENHELCEELFADMERWDLALSRKIRFICKITAAISEGINNKIKRLKRMAYGYRDVKYFLLKIHQHCGLLSPRVST